ncbi:vomeronasal type-2 receptor 116-like [Ctenodactylus gundi]
MGSGPEVGATEEDVVKAQQDLEEELLSSSYQNFLAFVFAIEEVNNNPHLLPNVSLGYEFHNFIHSHWSMLESSFILLTGQDEIPNYTCGRDSRPVVVLTGAPWATSAQIGPLLELYRFPQVTFGSFDSMLTENGQFPSLYQVAQKDTSLALGMISLMLHFTWTWFENPAEEQVNLDVKRKLEAKYDIINFWNFPEGVRLRVKTPDSICSESCHPGFRKTPQEGKAACCFDCTPCLGNEITNDTNMEACTKCPDHQYPNIQHNHCLPKSVTFLTYEDPLGMVLASTALSLALLTGGILGLFVKHRDTPIVKANNRSLSYILLLSLTFCFLCSLLFIGRPNTATCILQQTTFGLVFTMAVSTVLAKTLTVVLAFKVTAPGRRTRQVLISGAPNFIIPICSLVQFIVCGIWMGTNPPFIDTDAHSEHGHIIIVCNKGSLTAFYCVLGYLGSLALGTFTVAFLARNLPDTFNEAKFLTFSMVVFCSVWVAFLPVYYSTKGKVMVAMEVFSILASSAGLLSCIFAPKCYIILLRPDRNSVQGFRNKTHAVRKMS